MSQNESGAPEGVVRNMESHEAYNIINDLQKDGKMETSG